MIEILNKLETTIFPYTCNICNCRSDIAMDLCSNCFHLLPQLIDNCYICGAYLEKLTESSICCLCQENKPNYDRLCAAFSYTKPINNFITQVKFNRNLKYSKLLGELFAKNILRFYHDQNSLPEVIIPVPLSNMRHRVRGFNQSVSIFKYVSSRLDIKLDERLAYRVRHTKAQAKLDKADRKNNLKSAFKVSKKINFKHIAIVDDVFTTGSTVDALAYVFKEAGVELIDVWVIARA